MEAKTAFAFPHNNKSGTRKNSIIFIAAIISIWVIAFNLDAVPLKTHEAIIVSAMPIDNVSRRA